MQNNTKQKIVIIGAGLGGSFLALVLSKRGYIVDIYERFSEEEILKDYSSARSYNLTFYDYGVKALKEIGVWEMISPTLVELVGSVTQISHNTARFIKEKPYFAVQRNILLKTLIEKARSNQSVTFHFGNSVVAVNRQEKTIILQKGKEKEYKTIPCDVIFGADGVNSHVRQALQLGQPSHHIQEYANYQYKQIHLTKEHATLLNLQNNLMYAWTRKETLILAHPNKDESFSAILIVPKDKKNGFASLLTESAIKNFFEKNYADFKPVLHQVIKEVLDNPISSFVTIYTEPWFYKDFMVVLGDAAHGFNPFYGQGVSAAFADGLTLAHLIDNYGSDWRKIFPLYQKARKEHTDALATLSKQSIAQYLRYKKADYASIYNKIDVTLYNLFPKIFQAPPYVHIASNPLLTGDYLKKHLAQRKRARFVGMPFAVGIITGLVAMQEKFSNIINKRKTSSKSEG